MQRLKELMQNTVEVHCETVIFMSKFHFQDHVVDYQQKLEAKIF